MKDKEFSKDREFAVVLEKIHSDIEFVIEDLGSLKAKVNAIFEEQGNQKETVFLIRAGIGEIKELLKNHDKRIAHLETIK